jgi:hypothetical protein
MKTRKNINMCELESATSLVNYIRDDCIIDYLDILKKNKYVIDTTDNLKKRKIDETDDILNESNFKSMSSMSTSFLGRKRQRSSSFDYIVEDGYLFEENIFKEIRNKMEKEDKKNKNNKNLFEIEKMNNLQEQYNKSKEVILSKKYDLILGSLLINKKNNTYGYPDMIVSGYWINKYINDKVVGVEYNRNKYYIIDVKSSTITLINGGEHISSGLLYNGYKQQIYIYTDALNNLFKENNMNNDVNVGFVLGKKYKYISNKNVITINNPFERLGIIDYDHERMQNNDYKDIVDSALKWKKDLKKNWKNYTIDPINKNELYPNMKNSYDKNYKKIKKTIAYKNKELTLLWNVGIKNRKFAWEKEIKNYDHPNLSCSVLGMKDDSKRSGILNKMIDMTRGDNLIILERENNFMNWRNKSEYEFFVDFETYNSDKIYDESSLQNEDFSELGNNQKIYMIGICHQENNKYVYKSFIINHVEYNKNTIQKIIKNNKHKCDKNSYIFCENEHQLIDKFVDYIESFKPNNINLENYYKRCRLIHWSHAEPMLFNKKINFYRLDDNKYKLPWYDLLKVYKYDKHPIIIKECFSFGLKEIIKKLNEYNFIDLCWSDLDDGLLSSFIARDIYNNKLMAMADVNNNIINIVEYNYIDCVAIDKLLEWMREYINS